MAAITMPSYGCEHLTEDVISKIRSARQSGSTDIDPDFVQYVCLSCSTQGSFSTLDKHFASKKHDFAITSNSVYCGKCADLVYEPKLFKGWSKKRKAEHMSEEDEAFIATNTVPKPCGREGVRGLFNLGETCYMNAVLQMMVHNRLLSDYFLGMGHPVHSCPISREPEKKNDSDDSEEDESDDKDQKTCIACAMTELFSDAHMPDQTTPAHAVNLLFASWKHIPGMAGKGQQDAQEWFTIIIDKLHDSAVNPTQNAAYKPPSPPSHCSCFFHKLFYGRFYSDVTCDTCENTTTTESEYSSIDLDFQKQKKRKKKALKEAALAAAANDDTPPPTKGKGGKEAKEAAALANANAAPPIPTLTECLRTYTAPEVLANDAAIECGQCDTKRSAHKRLRMRKLPAILTMHVKRFGMKKSAGGVIQPEKYEGKLDYPLTIDMAPYTLVESEINGNAVNGKENGVSKENVPQYWYDLDCVVVHQGDHAHTGHYFAFCRVGERWYRFDDEIVSATTTEDVLRQEAYLLFYGLREIQVKGENDTNGVKDD